MTVSQDMFIQYYTDITNKKTYKNGTAAVLAAYPECKRNTAGVYACRMLKNPKIRAKIDNRLRRAEIQPLQAEKKKLNHKQFINFYTDIDNKETFLNATQSYLNVYGNRSRHSASVQASKLMSRRDLRSEIDRIIQELDLGEKVRLKAIKDVLTGVYTQETVTEAEDKDGNKYKSVVSKTPSARERLHAVDLLSKIDGTYDKNKAKADVMSAELKSLIKQHRKDMDIKSELQGTGEGGKALPDV